MNTGLIQTPIDRHTYSDFVVSLSVKIYTCCNCGFRPVVSLLSYLNELLDWQLAKIPCRNSIENWVKKCGYAIYKEPPFLESPEEEGDGDEEEYACIIDESIMLGSEKMVLSLGISAQKPDNTPLRREDVKVLDISVASCWNSEGIKEIFKATEKKMGQPPAYVVSDNDSKLVKSIYESGYIHIRDISHTLALFAERLYKQDEEFNLYTKELSSVKAREVMRKTSYLLPPRQRTIARFMNLSATVEWSKKMQQAFDTLNKEEQQTFAFVNTYALIISELSAIFGFINYAENLIKTQGLSKQTIKKCLKEMDTALKTGNKRIKSFKNTMVEYFKEEERKLKNKQCVWNASSDIIESLFGTFKFKRSKNSLYGVTEYVLILPLLTRMGEGKSSSKIDFKQSLENVFMKDLTTWREDNLTENLAIKRKIKLAG